VELAQGATTRVLVLRGAPDQVAVLQEWQDGAGAALASVSAAGALRLPANGLAVGGSQLVASGGNVGIGTAAPQDRLEVAGNLRLPPTTATAGVIRSGNDTLVHSFGTDNFFAGRNAGNLTTTGDSSTATGVRALAQNTRGSNNTATGFNALQANTTGAGNTATGGYTLLSNTTGVFNTANGASALFSNTSGKGNTATGVSAMRSNTTGEDSTATGMGALSSNTAGHQNTATGLDALVSNTTGSGNTANGMQALATNTTGNNNTAVGYRAGLGEGAAIGDDNTFVGSNAGPSTSTQLTNATAIGADALVGQSNALVLGGTGANAVSVGIGTSTPRSTLQVVGNYVQLPTVTGAPPPVGDCDEAGEAGRMVVRTDGSTNLYVCTGVGGWAGK
jgi:hypothetical protein